MVKYLNSPLKITGSLLMLAGFFVAAFTLGQLLFLGLSVFSLGILIHVTAAILIRSVMTDKLKKIFEILLILFIVFFFSILVMDYLGIIGIS
ncbi:MAG: hypothetical protein IT249_15550 [Chitinophagaceae bacterium]|nr:hypothetical protein [Chitinophagaceae bacterium]